MPVALIVPNEAQRGRIILAIKRAKQQALETLCSEDVNEGELADEILTEYILDAGRLLSLGGLSHMDHIAWVHIPFDGREELVRRVVKGLA